MKLFTQLFFVAIIFAGVAFIHKQQPKTITITVTIPKAELILKGLSKLTYEESAELIQDITMQAQRQLADTTKPVKKN